MIKIISIFILLTLFISVKYIMFSKNKKINYWAKKIDRIVTWFIIGSALASIFWLTHTKKWKELSQEIKIKFSPSVNKASSHAVWIIWKTLAFFAWIFFKK